MGAAILDAMQNYYLHNLTHYLEPQLAPEGLF